MSDIIWKEPVAGFEFEPEAISVTKEFQTEKLEACGLETDTLQGYVDASFFIAIGIHAGIKNGISAEGNVNMLTGLVQHRPVLLDEPLIVKGIISKVIDVPRGQTITTDVWFEDEAGNRAISAARMSLKPGIPKSSSEGGGAGKRPAPVIEDTKVLTRYESYALSPEMVKAYSSEGNSIHYEMTAANKAGFRAPIIGGGMGVHYLIHTLYQHHKAKTFDLSIYFRRPIFWDDQFVVAARPWKSMALLGKKDKVLSEARINNLE